MNLAPGLALLFDMDGVLIHSTELHIKAWFEYLARNGVKDTSVILTMLGRRNDEIVYDIFGRDLPADVVTEHGAAKECLYRELMRPVLEEHYVRGVRELLRDAHAQGVKLAVGSNAEKDNIDFVLDGANLRPLFSTVVDGGQVTHAKPHPEVYLTAAARIGVEPKNCIVFEDSPGGVAAGLAAGARVVGLLTTEKAFPQLELTIPDFTDPRLLPWLAAQRPA